MQKQPVSINFTEGLNTKTDPFQLPIGQFQSIVNSVFTKGGQFRKRFGYGSLPTLPTAAYNYLTTLNDNLTAIGQNVAAYDSSSQAWVTKGNIQPLSLSTLPLVRNSVNQTQCDSVVAVNGLVCTAYSEVNSGVTSYKYVIANSVTGQNIVAPTLIPAASGGTITGAPRIFLLNDNFVIVFTNRISATSHLQYITIPSGIPTSVTTSQDIAASYIPATTLSWDGVVFSGSLYIAYNTTSGGQAVQITALTASEAVLGQAPATPTSIAGAVATMMSLCVDSTQSNHLIYISYFDSVGTLGFTASIDVNLNIVQTPVATVLTGPALNIASAAQNGVCSVFFEFANVYGFDNSISSNFVSLYTVTGASASAAAIVARSIGLGSKAFIISGTIYFIGAYQSKYQSTYFLMNGSSRAASPVITAKIAYENGGGYYTTGIPNVTVNGNVAQIPYLYKDLIEPLSTMNNTQQTTSGGVYAQTGINLVTFDLGLDNVSSVEIAKGLQIGGGFGWLYDGFLPVEQNFFLWPENIEVTTSASAVTPTGTTTTGSNIITAVSSMVGVGLGASVTGTGIPANQFVTSISSNTITFGPLIATGNHAAETITVTGNIGVAQQYYYQAIYQWTDNQGNVQMSAPSIPVPITTTGTTSTNSVNIPTLRLTYKITNPAKLVLYRWSVDQPVYYQVTSITNAVINSTMVDYLTIYDSMSEAAILGNSIIYTTGGVVEDVNPPANNVSTIFDTRPWLVNAEDPNVPWFSKQVIEATPPEWSDLFTLYIAPNAGTVSTTGPVLAMSPMDDKIILFKANAMYYLNGIGPDNTGNPSPSYNGPVFITSTVGCSNPKSIVLIPQGLMFQSSKGIWLLGRDGVTTEYIGAPVEEFNSSIVQSAVSIPDSNEVRFTLDTGQTLLYDYFYNQWGTFGGAPAISSCIYQNLHSYINEFGQVFQETPDLYVDGANPVLMSFVTGWINLAKLQGFQRAYYFYLLGQYLSPHKLSIQVAYDYVETAVQSILISPNNFSAATTSPYGDQPAPFGSPINLEQWKIHFKRQKCQAFQLTVQEIYDPSFGVASGPGLTLSGINMMVGIKSGSRPIKAANTAG